MDSPDERQPCVAFGWGVPQLVGVVGITCVPLPMLSTHEAVYIRRYRDTKYLVYASTGITVHCCGVANGATPEARDDTLTTDDVFL